MEEIWKPVVGYEGLYEVSNLGRVKSIKYYGIKILKPYLGGRYAQCDLWKNNKPKKFNVHRLVLNTFSPCNENLECDHIDRNRYNNRLDNLRWVTRSENELNKNTKGMSQYRGVTFTFRKRINKNGDVKISKSIAGKITINKKTITLGYFKTESEAHEAYKQAFKNHYGYEWLG